MTDPLYPRDLVGYGRNPPFADWPGRARVAVQFVLNYEEGGENCVRPGRQQVPRRIPQGQEHQNVHQMERPF